jgi:microcystin-dependent protein
MYPALYQRLFNFLRDKNNGLESPDAAKLDIELDAIQVALSMCRDQVKGITTADGRLRNVPTATAAALVGTESLLGDGTQVLTTTVIPFQPAFSVNTVLVMINGQIQRPIQINSVTDVGGYLTVTMALAVPLGALCVIWAFEPGAGLLTRLADTDTGEGASLVAIEDATGLLDAVNVEDALAEIAAEFDAFVTAVGTISEYFKANGDVVATDHFDMGGFRITNAGDAVSDGDYVTLRQISGYISAWSDLQRFYMKRDGTTAMAGPFNFGNNKGYNLADPDLNQPLDAVNVRTMLRSLSTSGAAPVGIISPYAGALPPSADWLVCDGGAYSDSAYPVLTALLAGAYKPPGLPAQGCITAKIAALVVGDLTAGVITTMPPITDDGFGYEFIPVVECRNPPTQADPSGPLPTTPPTFNVSFLDGLGGTIDGSTPNALNGQLVITLASGGTGVLVGATIRVLPVRAINHLLPAFVQLPAGFFRVPDLRGRTIVGFGTESKTPGIVDPPSQVAGDAYDAAQRALGVYGGEEKHRLTVPELARHAHFRYKNRSVRERDAAERFPTTGVPNDYFVGEDQAHNTMQPYHVLNYLIKAK